MKLYGKSHRLVGWSGVLKDWSPSFNEYWFLSSLWLSCVYVMLFSH